MIVPPERLAPETLNALLESYVHREGTDYGEREASLEGRLGQLREQLRCQEVLLVFDEATESCNLLTRAQYQALQQGQAQAAGGSTQTEYEAAAPAPGFDEFDQTSSWSD